MSDLAKFIAIIIALPGFVIALILLLIAWWTKGLITKAILKVFNASSVFITMITILGIVVLGLSIFSLIGRHF